MTAGPPTIEAAMNTSKKNDWISAINSELASLNKHQVCEYVHNKGETILSDAMIIPGKLILTEKINVDTGKTD